ncbi:accessory Sec system translocase SecA2, partial [Vibrio cholerae]
VSQIFVSLNDYIVKKWSQSKLLENDKLKQTSSEYLENSKVFQLRVKNIVNKAQTVSEETSIVQREMANEFEKSISVQRDLIYTE